MAEDDEGGGQDGPVVEGHDQLVSLKLPHLVGDGLHLHKGVAVGIQRSEVKQAQTRQQGMLIVHRVTVSSFFSVSLTTVTVLVGYLGQD